MNEYKVPKLNQLYTEKGYNQAKVDFLSILKMKIIEIENKSVRQLLIDIAKDMVNLELKDI